MQFESAAGHQSIWRISVAQIEQYWVVFVDNAQAFSAATYGTKADAIELAKRKSREHPGRTIKLFELVSAFQTPADVEELTVVQR